MNKNQSELLVALNDTLDYAEKQLILYKGSGKGFEELERLRALSSNNLEGDDLYQALSDTVVLIDRAPGSGWCEMEMAITQDYRNAMLNHLAEYSIEMVKETCSKIHGGDHRQRLAMESLAPLTGYPELERIEGQLDSLERMLKGMKDYLKPGVAPEYPAPSYNPLKISVTHEGEGINAVSSIHYEGRHLASLDNPSQNGQRQLSELDLLMHARIFINGGANYMESGLDDSHLRQMAGLVNDLYMTALENTTDRAPEADIGSLKKAIQHFDRSFNYLVERPEMFPGKFRTVTADTVPFEPWVDPYKEPLVEA